MQQRPLVSHGSLDGIQLLGFVQEIGQSFIAQMQQLPTSLMRSSCWYFVNLLPSHLFGTASNLQLLQDGGHIGQTPRGFSQRQIVSTVASIQESLPC